MTPLEQLFGDGSDGDLTLSVSAEMAQQEYNLRSLTIDAGVNWDVPNWAGRRTPFIPILRVQSPIVLNGAIRANGVTAPYNLTGDGTYAYGIGAGTNAPAIANTITDRAWYLFAGGGGDGGAAQVYEPNGPVIGYSAQAVPANTNASVVFTGDRSELVGLDRPFRLAIGGLGGDNSDLPPATPAVGGGGAILIYAPAILFGPSGAIEAKGPDGLSNNGGGNGGGYVEIHTLYPIASADQSKVDVSGGAGNGTGGDGLDGYANFIELSPGDTGMLSCANGQITGDPTTTTFTVDLGDADIAIELGDQIVFESGQRRSRTLVAPLTDHGDGTWTVTVHKPLPKTPAAGDSVRIGQLADALAVLPKLFQQKQK